MKTLGIETSCDETAIAIYDSEKGIIGESVHSQMQMHAEYGGVVPELASRDHCSKIVKVLHDALGDTKLNSIDQIAYTSGPGLLGALLIGESFAQGLSTALNIPLISVNHLEGHLMSPMMEFDELDMPFICLLVSGGHSMIVDVKEKADYEILGQSQDDAVGEAFDKCAKILGLDYPGGPLIDKYSINGNENIFLFPNTRVPDLDFSFSGIKTSFLYFINDNVKENSDFIEDNLNDICASFQKKLIEMLLDKFILAIKKYRVKDISICGGVAANSSLRKEINKLSEKHNLEVHIPEMEYCTDNAAMIANYAHYMYSDKKFSDFNIVPYSKNII